MIHIGAMNELTVLRRTAEGVVLNGGDDGEVLLPLAEAPDAEVGQVLSVFLYHGHGNRVVATLQKPLAQVGEVAFLKVVHAQQMGAFVDWGLPKDLLLPWREVRQEQRALVVPGKKVMVAIYEDETGRVAASMRLKEFLTEGSATHEQGQKVHVIAAEPTDLGMRVIVDHRHWGMVHESDIFGSFRRGDVREGYVKRTRADNKLDITLAAPGYAKVDAVSQGILDRLERRGGFLPVTDKSEPTVIYDAFGVSKKAFKLAVGALYKARRITIEEEGIRLVRGE